MAEDDFKEYLRTATEKSIEQITDSAAFISIFSESVKKDPVALMQLGLAVVLDKPLYILAVKGVTVNENVRRLARAIEYATGPEDVEFASRRLLAQAVKDGFIDPK